MPLSVGSRIGPYEVLGVIGAGGMGEVYRARDTTLHREVAIKVLPESVAGNPKRLMRFEREARTLAALNHSNIATVYGFEEAAVSEAASLHARFAIVMELVVGDDLSGRLKRGAIPIGEALAIARQVAEALAAAHDAGIVHRDLKPANIKVRDDGMVKVLDFGLAKGGVAGADFAFESGSGSGAGANAVSGSGSNAADLPPTLTWAADITADGAVVGTVAYMSPEQAKGKEVDKRADIWAFGVVLFEMLAGRKPFLGDDAKDTMAQVLASDPDWARLPANTPSSIRRLLHRCLTRDRKQRLHDIADARLEIDEASVPGAASEEPSAGWKRVGIVATLTMAAGVGIGAFVWKTPAVVPAVTYARLDVSPATELNSNGVNPFVVLPAAGTRTALAWSPDGRSLAFIGVKDDVRRIYIRDLARDTSAPVDGTDGALSLTFSPGGDELAFAVERELRKVKIAGGPLVRICDAVATTGITWGPTRIVFGAGNLGTVSPAGGVPSYDIKRIDLLRRATPFLLPGERALLYTEYRRQWTSGDEQVMVRSLSPGAEPRLLLSGAADARYLPTGHLAFLRQGTLFVVPFDVETLELRGEPVAMVKDVAQTAVAWDSDDLTFAGQFAISPQGMLAYVRSPVTSYPDRELISIDRAGRVVPLGAPHKGYRSHLEVSPDGKNIGVSIQTTNDIRVFSYDLARGTLSRIAESVKGEVLMASWSRNDQIALQVLDGGKVTTTLVRPDAASPALPVSVSAGFWVSSLSPQGRLAGVDKGDILLYSPSSNAAGPSTFLKTRATEAIPMWSPDGRWLSYTSDITGRSEVYVRPFEGSGAETMISARGGTSAAWNPNGRELFYLEPGSAAGPMVDRMMSVPFLAGRAGTPAPLFSYSRRDLFLGTVVFTPYAVARDGQHFYAVRQLPRTPAPVTEIDVVFNWFEEVRRKAPTRR